MPCLEPFNGERLGNQPSMTVPGTGLQACKDEMITQEGAIICASALSRTDTENINY